MSGLLDLLAQNFPSLFGAPAPARPRSLLDTTDTNPIGTSSIYPPQVLTNPDPNVSPVVDKSTLTPQAAWGVLLQGKRGQPVTAAELPAAEAKANTMVDYGMAVAGATQPIRAFHGSPHTFDRFDLSRIGTGEGAQAYGHGLYFAGNEDVARAYREALSPVGRGAATGATDAAGMASRALQTGGGDPAKAAAALDYNLSVARAANGGVVPPEFEAKIAEARRLLADPTSRGFMYEVNLRTSPERLLDWDKPLSAQPIEARNIADTVARVNAGSVFNKPIETGADLYHAMRRPGPARELGYKNWSGAGPAEYLRDTGLDGIQYLDAGSRAAGDGTRNYVLFRDDIIDILRRYGLLGMVGGGAGAGLLGAPEQ